MNVLAATSWPRETEAKSTPRARATQSIMSPSRNDASALTGSTTRVQIQILLERWRTARKMDRIPNVAVKPKTLRVSASSKACSI